MAEPRQSDWDVDAVVSPSGDLVIPSDRLRTLSLAPGQRVHVKISPPSWRRNMYGILAGRLPDVAIEDIRRVRREVWGELAADS